MSASGMLSRSRLAADPSGVDPRRYLAPARDAMAQVVEHVLRVLAPSP